MTRINVLELLAVAAMLTGLGVYLYLIAFLLLMP